jgi:hypothetical protein
MIIFKLVFRRSQALHYIKTVRYIDRHQFLEPAVTAIAWITAAAVTAVETFPIVSLSTGSPGVSFCSAGSLSFSRPLFSPAGAWRGGVCGKIHLLHLIGKAGCWASGGVRITLTCKKRSACSDYCGIRVPATVAPWIWLLWCCDHCNWR